MDTQQERLYSLLPGIYRQRDREQGQPLQALMAALESEFQALEADMAMLYDDWFIESCEPWTIPYIAELIGVPATAKMTHLLPTQRREVANTLAYRRRKGRANVLEQVARDVTGWYVRAIEYGELLSITQHLAHLRLQHGRTIDVHQLSAVSSINGPFDSTAHTVDVRGSIQGSSTRVQSSYAPSAIGLFLWRLCSYLLTDVPAMMQTRAPHSGRFLPPGCFSFDPLGRDLPLFQQPQELADITSRVHASNLPLPLTRATLATDLATYRTQRHVQDDDEDDTDSWNSMYYGPERSLCIFINGEPLSPRHIISLDLHQWNASTVQHEAGQVGIDPELGRLLFFDRQRWQRTTRVTVNYCYGFSSELGGGPYERTLSADTPGQVNVLQGGKVNTLQEALAQWEQYCQQWKSDDEASEEGPHYTIRIVDNGYYQEDTLAITLPKNSHLTLEATDGTRPVIRCKNALTIQSRHASASLTLNGLMIDAPLILNGNLKMTITHCTLMPHGLIAQALHDEIGRLQLAIDHSISGPLRITHGKGTLNISDSILDSVAGYALDTQHTGHHSGYSVTLQRVTIFGKAHLQELHLAQDVIFNAPVTVEQTQRGQITFSYVPEGSQTPPCERCQPEMVHREQPWRDIYPLFSSTRYGDPTYAQLNHLCVPEIIRGASDGAEMGVFHDFYTEQRQRNLKHALDDYVPLGLVAHIFYMDK